MSDLMIPAWVEPMMRALRPELRKKLSLRDIDDIRKSVEPQIAAEREQVARLVGALEQIAQLDYTRGAVNMAATKANAIARAALGEGK